MGTNNWSRRTFIKRASHCLGGVALAGLGAGGISSCTELGLGRTLERARQEGTIKVGVAGERPYGFTDRGRVTGQAPELARVIFGNLGIPEIDAKEVSFSSLIPSLRTELFDVIAAGMAILPERCGEILFSDPDYCAQTAFLIRKGSPAEGITTFGDIADDPDIKLGTLGKGAVEYGVAIDSGVQDGQITAIAEQADAFGSLEDGRIDAFALTRASYTLAGVLFLVVSIIAALLVQLLEYVLRRKHA